MTSLAFRRSVVERTSAAETVATGATVVFVAGLLLFLTVPAFMQLQADSFLDLYLGRWVAQHGIPHHEVFAIANHGHPAAVQQWLADWLSYQAWRFGGYPGVAVLSAVAFASGYAMLAGLMRTRRISGPLAVSFAAFAAVSAFTLVFIRAQDLAVPLFCGVIWICLADERRESFDRRTVLLLPVLVIWANVHGSVVLGVFLAILYLLSRAIRMTRRRARRSAVAYTVLALAVGFAPCATPYGLAIVHYYKEFIGNRAMSAADYEWDAPAFPTLAFFQLAVPLSVAVGSAVLAWRRGHRPSPILVGAVILTGVGAALAIRDGIWLGMTAALLIADTAAVWIPTQPMTRIFASCLCALGVFLTVGAVSRLESQSNGGFVSLAPVRAIEATAAYADAHQCASILGDNTSVSALLWLHPELIGRVGFDGQLEAYSQPALLRWLNFQAPRSAAALELARPYTLLLATKGSAELASRLAALPHARVLTNDASGIAVTHEVGQTRSGAFRCHPG